MTANNDDEQGAKHAYYALTPDTVLDAVESLGLLCNGQLLALNSYENRVYRIGIEDQDTVVAKFYRPKRWSDDAIIEEHRFTKELAEAEIPVVPPKTFSDPDQTLFEHNGFRFAVYPNCGGRWPELDNPDNLMWIGRFVGRIHAMGKAKPFQHRPTIDIDSYGWQSLLYLKQHPVVPDDIRESYFTIAEQVLKQAETKFMMVENVSYFRIHADCHPGNILWTDDGPHFVDFDDARMGPAIQDLWMLLSGDRRQMTEQLADVLEGYTEFCDFNPVELHLLEALRSLRLIHYSAWLAKRWDDPSFPAAFPWFSSQRYWEEQVLILKEQLSLMYEEPLVWN